MTTIYPDYCALARPCNLAAALTFTALQILGGRPTAPAVAAAADQLSLALALLAPGAGDLIPKTAPPLTAATAGIARPDYRAAALVFSALQALGEYPADAPDYDATAVEHLRLALAVLAPGFGHLQILGAPLPVEPPPAAEEAPAAGPAWVKELLAEPEPEPEPEPPVGEHLWRMGEGTCARCGARARFAMGGQCSWRPEEPSTSTPPAASEAARKCACPRRDARDCIVERSRPSKDEQRTLEGELRPLYNRVSSWAGAEDAPPWVMAAEAAGMVLMSCVSGDLRAARTNLIALELALEGEPTR